MVEVFGARTVVHFSPKNLRLNAGFFWTVFEQSGASQAPPIFDQLSHPEFHRCDLCYYFTT